MTISSSAPARRSRAAFTLVELLVVIGIIALLISILLPALNSARRSANSVKCESNLRQIGIAFRVYASDNGGYYPPSRIVPNPDGWDIDGVHYDKPYWTNFLSKYVTRALLGTAAKSNLTQAELAKQSILWGCPAWEGYSDSSYAGGVNTLQNGYGMTVNPSFTPENPPKNSANSPGPVNTPNATGANAGNWYKEGKYTGKYSADRMLVTDSLFWGAECQVPPPSGPYPPAIAAQNASLNTATFTVQDPGGSAQTSYDIYRHGGQAPKPISGSVVGTATARFDPYSGKIKFNILFCDGHVVSTNEAKEGYRTFRMRFPG